MCLLLSPLEAYKNYTSQTYMFPHPLYQNIAAISGVWDEIVANKEKACHRAAVQALVIAQGSVHGFECTRGYFGMNCQPTMLVAGDSAPNVLDRNIRSEWLGIADPTFEGTLTLNPQQNQVGVILCYNQDLGAFVDWDLIKDWWVDIRLPIFRVKNRLSTSGSSETVVQAFNDPTYPLGSELAFARIDNHETKKIGVGVIQLLVGGTFLNHDGFFLDYYTGIGIPAEGKPSARSLFPATLGNTEHLTIIAGGHFKMPLTCWSDCRNIRLFLDIENTYYIGSHACRTFDLLYKQYSRYLPVRRANDTATIPAANVLTLDVHVSTGSFLDLCTGLEFSGDCMVCEIGYKLWSRGSEHIRPECGCCIRREPLFAQYGIADTSSPTSTATASHSTIANLAPADPFFTPIRLMDIDFCSGAAGGSVVQGLHAGLYCRPGYQGTGFFVGIGGFFEIPSNNAALKNWGAWCKLGMSF
jgi:hypothetical protein